MPGFNMSDYKEVAERLDDLFKKHPEASLRGTYEFVTIGDQLRVVYRAECYRTATDPAPAVGTAWEDVPGKTPYTKGSELQNAETSAWGRAIVAAGASTSKRIASADEVRSAQARQSSAVDAPREHPAAANDPESSSPSGTPGQLSGDTLTSVSRAKREDVKAKAASLAAEGVDVKARREEWHLPPIHACDSKQLDLWVEMLRDEEAKLPFEAASA